MQKRIMRDVIPSSGKSIRDIPIPKSHVRVDEEKKSRESVRVVREEFERHGKKSNKKFWWVIGASIIVIAIIVVLVMNAFAKATVTVTLDSTSIAVDQTLNTKNVPGNSNITSTTLSVTKQENATVVSTTTQDVETKASGTIIIFNDYSKASQKLVANTRFETPAGLIFRITTSVTVPGETTGKSTTTPGSVVANVVADQTGANYNIDLSDFTIPGFKGEPQYDGFFARSQTPMTGGFSGTKPVISQQAREATESSLRGDLQTQVITAANSSVPSGYILYPGSYRIDYESLPDTIADSNSVVINEQATLTGVALNENSLSSTLASDVIPSYKNEPITVTNLSDLSFAISDTIPLASSTPISFTLSGTANFVWTIDTNTLATQVAGKSKNDFTTVLQGYPHIKAANVSFFPLWISNFPSDTSRILIVATST